MTEHEASPRQLAERYVIGALLTDITVLRDVQMECSPRDFGDARLGEVYAGICRMVTQRQQVDYLTVWDQLTAWDVRGLDLADLSRWVAEVPTARNAGHYARMVRDDSVRRQLRAIGGRLQEHANEPIRAVADAIDALRHVRDQDAVDDTHTMSLRELLDVPEQDDTYDWVVPGLLERRDRFMLTGSEGGGKSTLLRQIAILAAAGIHPFRFSPIEPVKAVVVDVENSAKQWRRAVRRLTDEAQMRGQRDPRDYFTLHCPEKQIDINRPQDVGVIHRLLDEHRPDLVLIGPLYRLTPKSINNDDDATPVLAALEGIRDHGVAMLIEAHAGHAASAAGERDLRPRGSSALLGWPEFGMGLRPGKEIEAGGRKPFQLVPWRGAREWGRGWPTKLTRGQIFPWEPAGSMQG
jgi:hypothetical protein